MKKEPIDLVKGISEAIITCEWVTTEAGDLGDETYT